MAYFIPTNDPDFVYPERYEMHNNRRPKYYENPGEPKFKAGDLVIAHKGLYKVKSVERRMAKHGKGKGCYIYNIGQTTPIAENNLQAVTDDILKEFGIKKI